MAWRVAAGHEADRAGGAKGPGSLIDLDRQAAFGGDGHELRDRVDDLRHRYGAWAAAEDFQPGAAKHINRQADDGAGHQTTD